MKMIFSTALFFLFNCSLLSAVNIVALQYQDIEVTHHFNDKSKKVIIQRHIDPKCLDLAISHDTVFQGNYANKNVPNECKKTFITTLGAILPLEMEHIKTVSELEVLHHIKKSQKEPNKYILIDSRKSEWYENSTIPTAINLPYTNIQYDEDFEEEYNYLLKVLNIKKLLTNKLDFSNAKIAVMFCNGLWCAQSKRAIKELLNMGYPKEKLLWYRGGLQDWKIVGFTTIRGDLK